MTIKPALCIVLTAACLSLILAPNQACAAGPAKNAANTLTPAEQAAGWTLLFDGTTTNHWRGYKSQSFPAKGWVVENNCLRVTAGGGGGDIITTEQFESFELSIDFRVSENANSGIMYRVTEQHPSAWMTGPEYQILDDAGHTLQPTEPHSVGAMYDLYAPSADKITKPAGQFNTARIVVAPNRIEHWLNGVLVTTCDPTSDDYLQRIAGSKFNKYEGFGVNTKGHIALQDHGNDVWFRNIKIRDLNAPMPDEVALFDGTELAGWTWFPSDSAPIEEVWSIDDGVLVCKGKPVGYIRTQQRFTNFVLRLQWRFNPITREAGNSGVLLRMIGDDNVWPRSIEAQLHSGNAGDFWNIGDFVMSVDPERTNGRNTKKLAFAERPIGQWNQYEIIVDKGDVHLFINGRLVNRAWKVEEVAGSICLQSEGAEIHFRDIRVAPIKR